MSVLNTFQHKQYLCILTFSKCIELIMDQICIIYRLEEKKSKQYPVLANEVSVNGKTKNTLKYVSFPIFLLSEICIIYRSLKDQERLKTIKG